MLSNTITIGEENLREHQQVWSTYYYSSPLFYQKALIPFPLLELQSSTAQEEVKIQLAANQKLPSEILLEHLMFLDG